MGFRFTKFIKMRYIIRENRLTSIIERWLDENYGNLLSATAGGYQLYVPSRENIDVIFSVSPNLEVLIINKNLRDTINSLFGIEDNTINKLIQKWFNENYNQKTVRTRIEHKSSY
jgi:hypothetical protein